MKLIFLNDIWDLLIQILNTSDVSSFDYKISQSYYSLDGSSSYIHMASFMHKILIFEKFNDKNIILSALNRIPHWNKKGYKMPVMTYLSMLNALKKNNEENKNEHNLESNTYLDFFS